jgi:hypothetical protein
MSTDYKGSQERHKVRDTAQTTWYPLVGNIITVLKLLRELCSRSAVLLVGWVCFYLLVTPLGWFWRSVGTELLLRKANPSCKTYWEVKRGLKAQRSNMSKQW